MFVNETTVTLNHTRTRTRLEFPSYARGFAAMHDAMRRDAGRLVAAVLDQGSDDPGRGVPALARWFDHFEAVIEHHHRCEDEVVWPGLDGIIAAGGCGAEGSAFLDAQRRLLEDHQELDAAMAAVRTSLHAPSTFGDRRDVARHFQVCLDDHLTREEAAVFPLLTAHVSGEQFAVLEEGVVAMTPLKAFPFTLPWVLDGASADVIATVADGLPLPIRTMNRLVFQPRYRRMVAAATGERAS
jgi:Hemerythrin HHE cation binding domain